MFSSSIAYMTIYASGHVRKIDKVKKKKDFYLTSSQWRDHGGDAGMLVPKGNVYIWLANIPDITLILTLKVTKLQFDTAVFFSTRP